MTLRYRALKNVYPAKRYNGISGKVLTDFVYDRTQRSNQAVNTPDGVRLKLEYLKIQLKIRYCI